jgi:hypothetical protein
LSIPKHIDKKRHGKIWCNGFFKNNTKNASQLFNDINDDLEGVVYGRERWLHLEPTRKEELKRAASLEYRAWYRANKQQAPNNQPTGPGSPASLYK